MLRPISNVQPTGSRYRSRGRLAPGAVRRRILAVGLAALGLGLPGLVWGAPAAPAAEIEYQVKAGFLANFLKFVEWPERPSPPRSEWVIGVVASDAAQATMATTLAGKQEDGRPVVVRQISRPEEVAGCAILFIGRNQEAQVDRWLEAAKQSATLTMGEFPKFAQRGGMINFTLRGERIRLEINVDAAAAQRLQVSSRLANLGTRVRTEASP